jgi:hypothetical protein
MKPRGSHLMISCWSAKHQVLGPLVITMRYQKPQLLHYLVPPDQLNSVPYFLLHTMYHRVVSSLFILVCMVPIKI